MPGDHYYDLDQAVAGLAGEGLVGAREAARAARARLLEIQASGAADESHTPRAIELLAAALAEIEAAIAVSAQG